MSIYGMSDKVILRDIGQRVRQKRLKKNITQAQLVKNAGLNISTIQGVENGSPFGMLSLIQILRALNLLDEINNFLPLETISPIQLVKMKGKDRQRASNKKSNQETGDSEW